MFQLWKNGGKYMSTNCISLSEKRLWVAPSLTSSLLPHAQQRLDRRCKGGFLLKKKQWEVTSLVGGGSQWEPKKGELLFAQLKEIRDWTPLKEVGDCSTAKQTKRERRSFVAMQRTGFCSREPQTQRKPKQRYGKMRKCKTRTFRNVGTGVAWVAFSRPSCIELCALL